MKTNSSPPENGHAESEQHAAPEAGLTVPAPEPNFSDLFLGAYFDQQDWGYVPEVPDLL